MKRLYNYNNTNTSSPTSSLSSLSSSSFTGRKYVNFEDNVIQDTNESSTSHQPPIRINDTTMEKLVRNRQRLSIPENLLEPFAVEEEYNNLPDSSIAKQRRKIYEKYIHLYNQFREQNILIVQEIEIPYDDPMKYISTEDRELMFRNSIIQTFILNFQPFIITNNGSHEDELSETDCRYTWTSSEHMKKFMEMFDCEFTGKLMPVNNNQRVKIIFNFNIIDTMTEFNDRTVFVTIVIDVISGHDRKSKLFKFITYFFNICKNELNIMT